MPWAWIPLLFVAAAEPTVEVEQSVESAPAAHNWSASLQAGAGMVQEDPAALIRPRLGYQGSVAELTLGLPMWLRLTDRAPAGDPTPAVDEVSWLTDWRSPETYAAIVEHLTIEAGSGKFNLFAGGLKQEHLGYGALVDDFSGSLDPLRRRTGARLDLRLDTVQVEVMADSVVDPHLLGAEVTLAPLAWADLDDERRLRVATGFALDPTAPGEPLAAPVGGGDLAVGYVFWRSEHVALESYLTGAVLSTPGVGGHLGLRLEVSTRPGRRETNAVTVDLEGLLASEGYTPAYFDIAYQAERLAVPSRDDRPKRALLPPDGFGLRGRVDVRLGGARFGIAADSMFQGEMSASAYLRLQYDAWSVAGMVIKRDMAEARDLVEARPGTYAMLEAAVRFWEGFFAYATLHHGWRDGRPVTDWLGGFGYTIAGTM
jgi:hypothetical protein